MRQRIQLMLKDTLLFQTGKQNRPGQDTFVLDQTVLLRAVIQRVLADRDLTVYELLSVGSKAVAGLPP